MIRAKLIANSVKPVFSRKMTVLEPSGHCYACGNDGKWEPARIINDQLAEGWLLSDELRKSFDARESMFCTECGCSFRLRQLARCLTYVYGQQALEQLVVNKKFADMQIAEINSCGKLHMTLQKLPNLSYSEYGSKDKSIRAENLERLTYKDRSFDLVLTSDTLEHVPNIKKSFEEIRRILKPGGRHIFTVPVIWSRVTNNREGRQPSYHGAGEPDYLVFSEFGHDIIDTIRECGFAVKVYGINIMNLNDTAGVIIATKLEES